MKIILITLALVTIAPSVFSNQELDRAVILVELTRTLDTQKFSNEDIEKQFAHLNSRYNEAQIAYIRAEILKLTDQLFKNPELKVGMAKIYQSYFTAEEIEQLIDIYKSPVIQKFQKLKRETDQKFDHLVEELMTKYYMEAMVEIFTEVQKIEANQQVDPIVTTPVDKVEPQSTQGHP